MLSERKAKSITKIMYQLYGSVSGYLFGIPPTKRGAVESIVGIVLEILSRERQKL